jgi:diguanylate cyclase (GGDEF)-like protein
MLLVSVGLLTGHQAHPAIGLLALGALLLVAWLLRDRLCERSELARWIGTLSIALVIAIMATSGFAADGVLVWLALFPPVPFFLFGLRRGLLVSVIFTLLVVGMLAASILLGRGGGHSWFAVVSAAGALTLSTALAGFCEQARNDSARRLLIAANTDLLTGVPNRRGFLGVLDDRRALAERARQVMSLLVFDIDYLKQVNDSYGHVAGDAVIRHVASVVRREVRQQDLLGRLGGDEFALLLSDTPLDGALTLAAKLRAALRAEPLRFADQLIPVTLSIGAAQSGQGPIDFNALFAAADRQLYAAKSNGRDHYAGVVA